MKLRRLVTGAATAALVAGVTLAAPASAQESPEVYAALGDSYAAGVGAGDYDPDSGDCERSANAYPELWAADNSPDSFAFVACSGATTSDVLGGQLDSLSEETSLVSISIGGNDAGFADVMTTCVLQGTAGCVSRVDEAKDYIDSTLPGQLDEVYGAIAERAPQADVVVLGYPRMYELDGSCIFGISEEARGAINGAADDISAVTADRAAAHGFSYGDVIPGFSGHEICSSDEWLHSVTLPLGHSYHPTATGQSQGYYPVMSGLT